MDKDKRKNQKQNKKISNSSHKQSFLEFIESEIDFTDNDI